jgi:hypothetical protein
LKHRSIALDRLFIIAMESHFDHRSRRSRFFSQKDTMLFFQAIAWQ